MERGIELMDRARALSFDEKRAAEAAFRGMPVDPKWSLGAQSIYYGILGHTQGRNIVEETMLETACV
jgi:hypothetical protein